MTTIRTLLLTTVLLFLLPCAHAKVTRLEGYPTEKMHFANAPRFVCGVRVEEADTDFVLVDTADFNAHYLLMLRGSDERFWGSVDGIQVPQGWTVQLDASDEAHCRLVMNGENESRTYDFRFVPREGEGDWELERYSIQRGNDRFEAYIPGLWRMEMTQMQNGQAQQERLAWYFQSDCANLRLDDLPQSIAQAREQAADDPVAAIAPENLSDRVNLREGPGTDHPRVGSLYSGVMVRVIGDADGEWLYVNPLSGATQKAYVRRDLLAFGAEIWNVPNATRDMMLFSSSGKVVADEHPYHCSNPMGYLPSGVMVNVIGYYNDDWAIIGRWPGALYVEKQYLQE